jgi:hypothetical protein
MPVKKNKFHNILKTFVFCGLFLSFFGLISQSVFALDAKNPIVFKGKDCGSIPDVVVPGQDLLFNDNKVSSSDVRCRCAVNQCRLSTGGYLIGSTLISDKFACIQGYAVPEYRVGQNADLNDYLDSKIYFNYGLLPTSVLLPTAVGLNQVEGKGHLYTDLFAQESSQIAVPYGAVCKTSISDPDGTAYWAYPAQFDILSGKDPDKNGSTFFGASGQCLPGTKILFSNVDLFGNPVQGTQTFFGCLPNSFNGLTAFVARLVLGLSIIITVVIIAINFAVIVANNTSPDLINEKRKKMFSAFAVLIGILFSITILNIIGIQIIGLGAEGIGGSIFSLFVGGS